MLSSKRILKILFLMFFVVLALSFGQPITAEAACTDNDGDGYGTGADLSDCPGSTTQPDCDDTHDTVYPGAQVLCDGLDNNCDGWQDYYTDVDNDNDGVAWCAYDCNDNDPNIYPGQQEGPFGDATCSDGIDNDCDYRTDLYDNECKYPVCGTKNRFMADDAHMQQLLDPADDSIISNPCNTCHYDSSGTIDQRTECQRCHADPNDSSDPLNGVIKAQYPLDPPYGFGTAQNVKPHTSTELGTQYGNWQTTCLTCHNPHNQEQDEMYETNYGKYIKLFICFDNPVTESSFEEIIKFTDDRGPGSFADGVPNNENICEMCHTQTYHHRRDGSAPGDFENGEYLDHYDTYKCTDCHLHSSGFRPGCD